MPRRPPRTPAPSEAWRSGRAWIVGAPRGHPEVPLADPGSDPF